MPLQNMPPAEVEIDTGLVTRLVAAQFPAWSGLPVEPVDSMGWDNALFRLGRDLVVRSPGARRRSS